MSLNEREKRVSPYAVRAIGSEVFLPLTLVAERKLTDERAMSKTVMMIHGPWLTPACWDLFRTRYQPQGFT